MNARTFNEDAALAANVTAAYGAAMNALLRAKHTDMGMVPHPALEAMVAQAQASLAVADAIVWAADVVVEWFSPAEQPSPVADLLEDEDGAPYPEGVQAIARERGRQITKLGYTLEHDRRHRVADFVGAAVDLLGCQPVIPPAITCERANPDSGVYELDDLVRAGALIAAAIDRRLWPAGGGPGD